MKDNQILVHLALNRGSLANEKKQILKKHFPRASRSFIQITHLTYQILLLCYINPDCSLLRIYEHANIKSSIVIRILVKFNFLVCDKSKPTHRYNVTPLSQAIINDLVNAYKLQLANFELANKADKKAKYFEIKEKIKDLKQK